MSTRPEFSRLHAVERLPPGGLRFALQASEAERQALARRFELVALDRLEASGMVAEPADGDGLLEVAGRLRGSLSQRCVVTLEPVPAELDVPFRRVFTREAAPAAALGEVEIDPEAEEPEPLEGPLLDLGELVAEELAVALDPYPRAPGAEAVLAELAAVEDGEATDRGSPFAALGALRGRH